MKEADAKEKEKEEIKRFDEEFRDFNKYKEVLQTLLPQYKTQYAGYVGPGGVSTSTSFQALDNSSPIFTLDSDQITALKNTFKSYKTALMNVAFQKEESNSPQIGFIPVELSFSCDGLSGWKIYNKIDVL